MTKRILMQLVPTFLSLALATATARELAPGEVNGIGPERLLTKPRVTTGDIPHPCKLSQPSVATGVQFTNQHTNALRRWGTVHFHIPGGCSDWDFVISKWQEAIGSQITGTISVRDVAILDQQIKAAGGALSIAQSQRVAEDQERVGQKDASERKEAKKPTREGLKYWQADPRPTDLEIPFDTTKLTINGNSTIDPLLAARLCTMSHRNSNFPGTQIQSVEVSQIEFLDSVDVSSIGQSYKLPIASGILFPVKIRARLKVESYSKERQHKDIGLRGFIYKDSFGEWACRDAS